MKKNMSNGDRLVRLAIIITIAALYFFGVVGGTVGIALLAVAGILLLTTFVNFCPIYRVFGISTCSIKQGS